MKNAWNIFEQLGYYMHWYISATTTLSAKWLTETPLGSPVHTFTFPRFTEVCNADNSIHYTTTEPLTMNTASTDILTVPAIQGIPHKYSINGVELITINQLDNNKLYFTEQNVAENGIFINNIGLSNYSEWQKVDNLAVQSLGIKCYKFGVDVATSQCYIEFPEDAYELFDEGINITYITSLGLQGNIKSNVIQKFVNSTVVDTNGDNVDVTEEEWFNNLKELAEKYKFTSDRKEYKNNPLSYNGQVGDVAGFIRVMLAGRKNTPNIYFVQKILGKDKVIERIKSCLNVL